MATEEHIDSSGTRGSRRICDSNLLRSCKEFRPGWLHHSRNLVVMFPEVAEVLRIPFQATAHSFDSPCLRDPSCEEIE